MRDALVIGSVTSTVKHPCLHGKKLLIVQVLNVKGEPEGRPQIVVDFTGAGKGDRVLLSWDGIGSQEYHNDPKVPQRAWLSGIIDETYIAATIERAGENESAGIGRSGN